MADSVEAEASSSSALPKKKTRVRQQQSCSLCHQDKKACDKNVPCSRCVKRGLASSCHRSVAVRAPTGSATPLPRIPASVRTASSDINGLQNRIKALEAALRASLNGQHGPVDKQIILRGLGVSENGAAEDELEDAAVALGELAFSGGGTSQQQFHGPGSVAQFLSSTFQPGSSAPITRSYFLFGNYVLPCIKDFPVREVCEHLSDLFWSPNHMSTRFIVTPKATFVKTLNELLEYRDALLYSPEIDIPLPCSLSFVSLASIFLAIAVQFLPESSIPFITQYYPSYRVLEEELVAQAKLSLSRSEEVETATRYRIEATMFQGLYLKNLGRPSDNYHGVSLAIRTAQSLGLHREGSFGLSPYEVEIRRRQWYQLYAYDKLSNFAFGRPYVIHDRHCDTAVPANVNLENYDPATLDPIPSLPLDQPTSYTAHILEIELATIVGRITDRVFSAAPYTYRDVVECDAELLAFEEGLPPSFKIPSFELVQTCPSLPMQYNVIFMMLLWVRNVLHRPYLLRPIKQPDLYARSRATAISLSQKLISAQRDLHVTLSITQKKFFILSFQVFDPACTLAMAILQDPSLADALDPWILEARGILSRCGPHNLVATEGIRCLNALRRKIASQGTRLTDLAPDEGETTIAVPYLGITASIVSNPTSSTQNLSPAYPSPASHHSTTPNTLNGSSSSSDSTSPPAPPSATTPATAAFVIDPAIQDDSFWYLPGDQSWPDLNSQPMSWPLGAGALDTVGGDPVWTFMLKDMGVTLEGE